MKFFLIFSLILFSCQPNIEDPKRAIQNILFCQTEAIIVNWEKYHGLMPAIKINDDDLLELVNHILEDVNAVEDKVNLKDIEWVRQNH